MHLSGFTVNTSFHSPSTNPKEMRIILFCKSGLLVLALNPPPPRGVNWQGPKNPLNQTTTLW